jgi:hypothetical protein
MITFPYFEYISQYLTLNYTAIQIGNTDPINEHTFYPGT